MSDLITIPWEDNFETTLTQSRNGGVGDVLVNDIPTSTIASGEKSYIVVNPWKSNMQVARVSGWTASPSKKFTVDSIAVNEWNATAYTQKAHSANSVVRFSNNYQFWKDIQTAVNSKTDSSDLWAFTFVGSKIQTPWNMSFKDDNNVELTLAQIASGGGADQKVAITTNDTTTGTLNDKLLVGSGLTKTTNNPWGAETMTLAPDTNVLATKAYVDWNVSSSLIITSDYPLWEPITDITKSCVFKETAPTFAQATTAQNVGDVANNTRVYLYDISNWVYSSMFKIALKKIISPSVAFNFRLQSYNGSAWVDVDTVNAIATIAAWTVTTSFVDTTITWAGVFTMPVIWTKLRLACFVGTRWSETVNATNYYAIWHNNLNTTTRYLTTYNGTIEANTWLFPYWSWVSKNNIALSLTDSDFSYKIATYWVATAIGEIGTYPKLTVFGASNNFTGMNIWTTQYLNSDKVNYLYGRKQLTKDTYVIMTNNVSNIQVATQNLYASHTPSVTETITGVKVSVKYVWYTWNPWVYHVSFNVKIYSDNAGVPWTLLYTGTQSAYTVDTNEASLTILCAGTLTAWTKYRIEFIAIGAWSYSGETIQGWMMISNTRVSTYNDYWTKDTKNSWPFVLDNTKNMYFELQVSSPTLTSVDNYSDTYLSKSYWTIRNVAWTNSSTVGKAMSATKLRVKDLIS